MVVLVRVLLLEWQLFGMIAGVVDEGSAMVILPPDLTPLLINCLLEVVKEIIGWRQLLITDPAAPLLRDGGRSRLSGKRFWMKSNSSS